MDGGRGANGAAAVRRLQRNAAADEGQRNLPGTEEARPEGGGKLQHTLTWGLKALSEFHTNKRKLTDNVRGRAVTSWLRHPVADWITSWWATVEMSHWERLPGSNAASTCVNISSGCDCVRAEEWCRVSVLPDAESERWRGCHAASGPAGGAVLRAPAAAVRYQGGGAALWRAAAQRSAAESTEADDRWDAVRL